MLTRLFAPFALLLCLGLTPAFADALEDSLVAQLKAQGYASITVNYTFLGRLHLIATSANGVREIVVNPKTGEILRDYLRENTRVAGTGDNVSIRDDSDTETATVVLPEIPTVTPTTSDTGDALPMELIE